MNLRALLVSSLDLGFLMEFWAGFKVLSAS